MEALDHEDREAVLQTKFYENNVIIVLVISCFVKILDLQSFS